MIECFLKYCKVMSLPCRNGTPPTVFIKRQVFAGYVVTLYAIQSDSRAHKSAQWSEFSISWVAKVDPDRTQLSDHGFSFNSKNF